ncbi:MAG: hypothetical protein JWN34_974 [Bryobacterales bacterium]|nr:hypothetical protein [Bryobacterales bacterium]
MIKRTIMNVTLALWTIGGACLALAQQSAGRTFPSASDAGDNLYLAVQSNDERAIADILGGPTDLTSSGEPGQDLEEREQFVRKCQEMHRLHQESNGAFTLYLGAENWPFPFPVVRANNGWRFDSDAGEKEILFRRIGENELTAIAECEEFGAARNSLPANSNGDVPLLLHGYYFRLLPKSSVKRGTPDGFTLIAYPAEYRSSGVKTFVVAPGGFVYEKDIGTDTAALASTVPAVHKDATWRPVAE